MERTGREGSAVLRTGLGSDGFLNICPRGQYKVRGPAVARGVSASSTVSTQEVMVGEDEGSEAEVRREGASAHETCNTVGLRIEKMASKKEWRLSVEIVFAFLAAQIVNEALEVNGAIMSLMQGH